MKPKLLLSSLLVLAPVFAAADKGAPTAPAPNKSDETPKRHPLRGVIMAVHADKSALMVKHEDIPGLMRAMTMMFKVDEGTLKTAKPGQAITGMLSRDADAWWLHDVKIVSEKKP